MLKVIMESEAPIITRLIIFDLSGGIAGDGGASFEFFVISRGGLACWIALHRCNNQYEAEWPEGEGDSQLVAGDRSGV